MALAASTTQHGIASDQTIPLTQTVILRPGFYEGVELDSFSNTTKLAYAESSDFPISTALMTADQYNDFVNNPNDAISNSITNQNGTSVANSAVLPIGQYFLVFYSDSSRTLVRFGYDLYPSTPFSYGAVSSPVASGIASFGISNVSGVVIPYEVKTSQITGVANITAFQVDTWNASSYSVNVSGSTLQLNAVLVVNDSGSSLQKVYWVQNTPDFVTAASKVSFGDEIWNNTDTAGFLSNQTVTSTNFQNGGFVSSSGIGNPRFSPYVYDFTPNNVTYSLPLRLGLLMSETVLPSTGVLVQLGYRLLANGTEVSPITRWFDNVTIRDPRVQAAFFDISGNATTPVGDYYDAELVFAGEANLELAHFTQLNATLGLFYQSGSNKLLSSFPTYYGFSGDTGEAADDLVVTYEGGLVHVVQGTSPNYEYLGNSSLTLDPATMHALGVVGHPTGTTSGTSGSSSVSSSTSGLTSSSASETSSPLSAGLSLRDLLIASGAGMLFIAIVAAVVTTVRGRQPRRWSGEPGALVRY